MAYSQVVLLYFVTENKTLYFNTIVLHLAAKNRLHRIFPPKIAPQLCSAKFFHRLMSRLILRDAIIIPGRKS